MKSIIYILVGMLMMSLAMADITGSESVVINVPTSMIQGASVPIEVEALDVSSPWAASITVTVLGGCTINGNTELSIVMVSDLPNPLPYTILAPPDEGVCTINWDYKFGDFPTSSMQSLDIIIGDLDCTPNWQCGTWSAWSNTVDSCGTRTRTCTDTTECAGSGDYIDTESDACEPECTVNADCSTGEVCTNGLCIAEGTTTDDDDGDCNFLETKKGGKCELNMGMIIVLGFGALILTKI